VWSPCVTAVVSVCVGFLSISRYFRHRADVGATHRRERSEERVSTSRDYVTFETDVTVKGLAVTGEEESPGAALHASASVEACIRKCSAGSMFACSAYSVKSTLKDFRMSAFSESAPSR